LKENSTSAPQMPPSPWTEHFARALLQQIKESSSTTGQEPLQSSADGAPACSAAPTAPRYERAGRGWRRLQGYIPDQELS